MTTHPTPDQLAVQNWIRDLRAWAEVEAASGVRQAWQHRLRQFAGGDDRPPFDRTIREALQGLRAEGSGSACLPADDRAAAGLLAEQTGEAIEGTHGEQCERGDRLIEAAADIWGRLAAVDPAMAAGAGCDLESWPACGMPRSAAAAKERADADLDWFAPILSGDEETALRRLGRTVAASLQRETDLAMAVWQRFEAERLSTKARQIAGAASAAGDPAPGGDPEPPEPPAAPEAEEPPEAGLPEDMAPADWLAFLQPVEREILGGLRTGPATRVVLAGRIHRDRSAVKPNIDRLIRLGLVETSGQRQPLRLTATGREAHRSISEAESKAAGKAVRR